LRRWIRRLGLPIPAATHIRHIVSDVILAPRDREPCVRWSGVEVRRYRERLFVMPQLAAHDCSRVWSWDGTATIDIPGVGRCCLRATRGEGLRAQALMGRRLTLRFRRGGERFHPFGRPHGHALKGILQEAGIPPWERGRIPLLYLEDDLVAVAGLGVSTAHVAQAAENGLIFEWQKERPFDTLWCRP
jgi:tRNA(Ile)-lysidine synthase